MKTPSAKTPEQMAGDKCARRDTRPAPKKDDFEEHFFRALREGDSGVWNDFFRHFDQLIRPIVSWVRWHFDAHVQEDVVQTIRREIVRSMPTLQQEAQLRGFIRRICVNRCIDEVRRQSKDRNALVPIDTQELDGEWVAMEFQTDESADPIHIITMKDRATALGRILDQLDTTCRTAIRLFYEDGLSYKEMAECQNVAVNTIGSRLAKCLAKLRQMVGKDPVLDEVAGACGKQSVRR